MEVKFGVQCRPFAVMQPVWRTALGPIGCPQESNSDPKLYSSCPQVQGISTSSRSQTETPGCRLEDHLSHLPAIQRPLLGLADFQEAGKTINRTTIDPFLRIRPVPQNQRGFP